MTNPYTMLVNLPAMTKLPSLPGKEPNGAVYGSQEFINSSAAASTFAILIVGLIGWYISFKMFVNASCEAAASVKWAGLWPKVEE